MLAMIHVLHGLRSVTVAAQVLPQRGGPDRSQPVNLAEILNRDNSVAHWVLGENRFNNCKMSLIVCISLAGDNSQRKVCKELLDPAYSSVNEPRT